MLIRVPYCSLVFQDEVCLDVDLNYLSFLLPNFFVAYYLNIKQSILVTYMVGGEAVET